jgi:phage terminase large subunit GpA-like protein
MAGLQFPDPAPRYRASWAAHLEPPLVLPLDEWADGRVFLPREMAPEPGLLNLDRTPYLREILRAWSDPDVEENVLQCGTQLGKSTAVLLAMAQCIAEEPAPMMVVLATLETAKKFSRQRVSPLIRSNAFLADKLPTKSRDGGNTVLLKEFTGGTLALSGANSAASLASMSAKNLLGDEFDDWPDDVDGQGEPVGLVIPRQDSFGSRARRMFVSSPKKPKGAAGIEQRRLAGTDERYEVPCPHCGEFQELEWGNEESPHGIKWQTKDGKPLLATVGYSCAHCRSLIPESAKPQMLAAGRWIAKNPGARTRSFLLPSLYSPLGWLSWRQMVQEWCRAQDAKRRGDTEPLKTFTNTRLAKTWEDAGVALESATLKQQAEAFPLKFVPSDALVLLAGVDVQDDRFEVAVYAIGPKGAMWTADTMVLVCNPALEESWNDLDAALLQRYEHEDGFELGIEAFAVDTGGHYTHEAYNFVRSRPPHRKAHAIKGGDKPGMPIVGSATSVDVNWRGRILKGGVKLWHIGVNAAKDRLFGLMRAKDRVIHFSNELDDEFFEQITAEQRVQQKTARGKRFVWVKRKGRARNEQLDLAVYVLWLVEKLKLSSRPPAMWKAQREKLLQQAGVHAVQDIAQPITPAPASVPAPPAQNGQGQAGQFRRRGWFR